MKSNRCNKLLIAVSALLLAVVTADTIYLLSQTRKNDLPLHESTDNTTKAYKELKAERAFHPKTLAKLADFLKSPSGSVYILQENTTKVLEVEPKGACVEDRREGILIKGSAICFPFAMKVESKILPEGYTWTYLTEVNINKTKVYIKDKDGEKTAHLKDIRPDDMITTVERWDPSVPWDVVKLIEFLDNQMVDLNIYISRI